MGSLLLWFALKNVPGVGNLLSKRLLDCFQSPDAIFNASSHDLLQVEGMSQGLVSAIRHQKISDQIKREIDLVSRKNYKIVTLSDPDYPALLLQIPDPPPYLYVYGSLETDTRNIAVVGSRNATAYGISTTQRLCTGLAYRKITIVSGMAQGIDTAAHQGALAGKGKTIAVLGSGLERVYPSENRNLFHQIAESGAVISEFSLLAEPDAYHFPARNRIISGISLGTVIVEATRKSGSLITARLAAEQNREVFAVPGSIHSFKSTGTHNLIKQGAKLVEHAQDILDELPVVLNPQGGEPDTNPDEPVESGPPLSLDEALVFKALGPYPIHIDNLIRKMEIEPGKLSGILLKLELQGIVHQAPGKLFTLCEGSF